MSLGHPRSVTSACDPRHFLPSPAGISPVRVGTCVRTKYSSQRRQRDPETGQSWPARDDRAATCGRGSAGRASPCQGEGRGFESRRPLGGAAARHLTSAHWDTSARRGPGQTGTPGTKAAEEARSCGGVAEWLRQGPAKPCTRVRFPSPPPSPLLSWEISLQGHRRHRLAGLASRCCAHSGTGRNSAGELRAGLAGLVAQADHVVEPLVGDRFHGHGLVPADVDAVAVAHHDYRVRVQGLGADAGAGSLGPRPCPVPQQRLGHRRAATVPAAHEQHPPGGTTPIREALLELSFEGLVEIAPRSGVKVLGVSPA
jgi:Bacterial regulatory proteins, gntR family